MKPYLLLPALLLLPILTIAQGTNDNLVLNHSFETSQTPDFVFAKANPISTAQGWSNPNEAAPDIYSTTEDGYIYDEYGSLWHFNARSGKNVAAIHVYGELDELELRDYVQGSLTQALTVGQTYEFSFWVHYHCEGANNIGIVFLPKPVSLAGQGLIDLEPAAHQEAVTPYSKSTTWTQVKGTFVAYQPYTHFMVGNFFSNAETELESRRYNHYFAYIDDIVVRPVESTADAAVSDSLAAETAQKWKANIENLNMQTASTDIYLIDGFPQDGAALHSSHLSTLNELAALLIANSNKKVTIKGYASSEGSKEANLRIAKRRCQAVASYLEAKGVEESQIRTEALGEQEAIASNATVEGRKRNRRVELTVE